MSRKFIKELGGDLQKEAIDNYDHIDSKGPLECYLAHLDSLVFDSITLKFPMNMAI